MAEEYMAQHRAQLIAADLGDGAELARAPSFVSARAEAFWSEGLKLRREGFGSVEA
jgi:hypothetical protein